MGHCRSNMLPCNKCNLQSSCLQVQYPGSLPTMMLDLRHIRVFANYLRHTEIKFDLVSAVDELASQVRMEFDFVREAQVMDSIATHLQAGAGLTGTPTDMH